MRGVEILSAKVNERQQKTSPLHQTLPDHAADKNPTALNATVACDDLAASYRSRTPPARDQVRWRFPDE
jgi:hypothetical protein